ncbi:hypothetical protein BVRB_7g169660 isoform A [Beta vulgaris subsp. vulgaris]|uniref:protein PHYTOCHROME-DEPENDENT LATE-FLOWERING isoform X2 n=1 Tax=Beta vulgaris subsp. vulgaris TaxID=3555 RepID=UPI00053F9A30|nr:protein PHYTOCHROME-DEPENDENT LATE-FLOWERING isoform X2 [Beta vulgaris subsp. vulgaris]KMT04790.1 hypothetical protein BVRB_7g169660 isoform A [Beta vulgaris subsp. vulgaris]
MGISFKIAKKGTRYKPKIVIPESIITVEDAENLLEKSRLPSKIESNGKDEDAVGLSGSSLSSGRHHISAEDEVSFILNLYPDGYSIGKPSENDSAHAGFQEGSMILHPYDRTSEGLFTAIESGRLPGCILDDIPCKYIEGALTCEVRDYRKCMSDPKFNIRSSNGSAVINKVRLKMSLENVVKDIPLMADDSWTYGDLMEVESRILKALQPKLFLDPMPKLDRLCKDSVSLKLNLGLMGSRKRRLRQIPEVTVTANNRPHGKKICIDRAPESSSYRIGELGPTSGDVISQHVQDNIAAQGLGNQRNMHDPMQGPVLNAPGASPAGQDMPIPYSENMNSTVLGKMEGQETQLSPYLNLSKRTRQSGGPDGVQHQPTSSYVDAFQGSEVQWRNQLMQPQSNARGIQYANPVLQRYPQLAGEGITNHQDVVKLEKADPIMVKTDMQMMEAEGSHMDPRFQQRFQNPLMRPGVQQGSWNNISQQVEKDFKKEEQYPKRKPIHSPRLSAGAAAQSPLTAKATEVSCGSMGTPYGAVPSAAGLGQLQREKTAVTSIRSTSITSSANDSMQPHHQVPKRRSNSLPKTPVLISGIGSPASVNNMGGPMSASSPSVSTPQLGDQNMLERFAKIEMVAMRHQLNRKKNKVEEYPRRSRASSSQELQYCLTNAGNYEYSKDEIFTSMSKSMVGGSMNVCKIRMVTVQPQVNTLPVAVRTRLILSEKPNDGIVAMHYGELEVADFLNAEDYLPTLPNTHLADLLAMQFCALMNHDGYFIDDQVQPRPPRNTVPSNSQPNTTANNPNNSAADMQQYPESNSGQQTVMETKPNISSSSLNSIQNLPSSGMLPPGNSQSVQMSQAHVSGVTMAPRQHQVDQQQPLQQQQQPQQLPLQNQSLLMPQQQPQFQRSPLMLPTNSMAQLNACGQGSSMPLGNHMGNKPSPLQLLQPQQQPQSQMQRRMMMNLGPAMGMGNIGNNMAGLGGLSNVMGIGGARGISGAGISAPMGAISGIGGNMGQNSMNMSQANAISQHIRAGNLTPAQAQAAFVAQRFKLMQNRSVMGTQSGVAGIPGGTRQLQQGSSGLSMLGAQSLNRGNINPMQRNAMGQMGMGKLMPGMNVPMNQQQHLQLQQQFQQQQQHLQQQQQLLQQQPQLQQQMPQQEATSPLQAVVSSQQVGSPSTLGIPQQMNQQAAQQQASPQQMGQRTPMSPPLSSGPMHPMSAGNPEACPASPALSSQTLGSVGSITNSSMDLQGVNKSNSVTNT